MTANFIIGPIKKDGHNVCDWDNVPLPIDVWYHAIFSDKHYRCRSVALLVAMWHNGEILCSILLSHPHKQRHQIKVVKNLHKNRFIGTFLGGVCSEPKYALTLSPLSCSKPWLVVFQCLACHAPAVLGSWSMICQE